MSGDPVTREDVVRAAETIRGRVRRTPLLDGSDARAGARAQGRAAPAHRLVQGARRRQPALGARRRGARARRRRARPPATTRSRSPGGRPRRGSTASSSPGRAEPVQARPRARARRAGRHRGERPGRAFVRLEEHLAETGRVLVHPFDDPLVMAGQGTVGLEVLEDAPDVDAIAVPVGGGGLVSGIAAAVARRAACGWSASSPRARPRSGWRSRPGEPVPVTPEHDRERARRAVRRARTRSPSARRSASRSVTVTDDEIEDAMRRGLRRREARLRAGRRGRRRRRARGRVPAPAVVAVVSGGNVGPEIASDILASP